MQIDLTKNIDTMKKDELQKYARELIAHIKGAVKQEAKAEELAEEFPYEAVSVIDKKFVTLKFDLESKKARVIDVKTDSRDVRNNNMAVYFANNKLIELGKKQKEISNEKN